MGGRSSPETCVYLCREAPTQMSGWQKVKSARLLGNGWDEMRFENRSVVLMGAGPNTASRAQPLSPEETQERVTFSTRLLSATNHQLPELVQLSPLVFIRSNPCPPSGAPSRRSRGGELPYPTNAFALPKSIQAHFIHTRKPQATSIIHSPAA